MIEILTQITVFFALMSGAGIGLLVAGLVLMSRDADDDDVDPWDDEATPPRRGPHDGFGT